MRLKERERQKSPEKNHAFPSRINKVIEIKNEPLPERVTKTIHLKEDQWEKKVIRSESNKEEAIRKSYPLRSRKTVNLVTRASNTFNNTTVNERYQQNNLQSKIPIPTCRKHAEDTF